VVGTPTYMAPEQAAKEKQLTTAADVYALGATLYELLTGHPPFKWSQGENQEAYLLRIQTEEPPVPRRLVPQLNPELEAICLKCLRKEPDKRYASAEGLATDLEQFLDGKETSARQWSKWRRGKDRARRHWAALTVSLLLLSSALLAVLLLIVHFQSVADEANNQAAIESEQRKLDQERAASKAKEADLLRQQLFDRNVAAARRAAERGDWEAALQLYSAAREGLRTDDPLRLSLEVEALPGWFLYRSRQQVGAELDRLDCANLNPQDRATVRLLRADLGFCLHGRAKGPLDATLALLAE